MPFIVGVLGVALVALVGLALVLPKLLVVPEQRDFDAYFVGARMLNAHQSAYASPSSELLGAGSLAPPHREYVYPPLFAGLLRPLAVLPYRTASSIWLLFNIAITVVLVVVLARLGNLARRHWWFLAFGVLVTPAVYQTWLEGQVSVLVALLLALGLLLAMRTSAEWSAGEWVSGISLGLAGAIKVYPVLVLPVLVWHGRWRLLAVAVGTGIGATMLGAVLSHGLSDTQFWFREVLPSVASRPWPSNQSLLAVVSRFGPQQPFAVWNGSREVLVQLRPLLSGPAEVSWIVRCGTLLVLGISGAAILRRVRAPIGDALQADFCLAITTISIITPVVWDHYYVQLAIPVLLLLNASRRDVWSARLLLGALGCLVAQRYWRQMLRIDESGWVLMSGLVGVILLWVGTVRLTASPEIANGRDS